MTPYIAVHRSPHTSLAVARPYLAPDELSACATATELLQRLEALVATREAELAAARTAAHDAGHAAGREQALRDTAPRLLAAWARAADAAQTESHALRGAAITLALQIVQRIAAGLAAPDVVAALAERAAEALPLDRPALVRVHPSVVDAVRDRLPAPQLDVRADAALAPLDCVFETPAGQLLAGLDGQLARVGAALRAAEEERA